MHNVNLLMGADAKLIYDFEAHVIKGVSLAFGGLYRASATKSFSSSRKGRMTHSAIEKKYLF
jgi:hypothetical protein